MAYWPSTLQSNYANPPWMNKADNAWQLTSATLVGLQSVPGLVILYGSIVKKKWALNSALMALYAFAAVLVCWVGWGYQLAFGDTLVPFLGKPDIDALEQKFLMSQSFIGKFPNASMVYFQFVFAAITLILIAGALLGRMNFIAWMLFVPLWLTFSYTVGAFSIWCPQGWLFRMGVIDYSGGFVIHLSSGVAGFTAAYWVGPRAPRDRERFPPNNILLMLAGAGILWMGWTGFNGGDPYVASLDASLAVLNTHVCAAMSLLTWLMLDILFYEKPSVIGATQGMITGLVCITPAAGVVQGWAAIIMGLLSGCIPWFSMMFLHKKMWLLKQVDDTMAVFHTHAVAGTLGAILAGVLANPRLSRIFYMVDDWTKYTGLAYVIQSGKYDAGLRQLLVQLIGIGFVFAWNVISTSVICLLIRMVVPLRMTEEEVSEGDNAVHGEEAYALWGDGEKFDNSRLQLGHEIEEAPLSKSGYGL
ncbi:Ammonium transporter 3 member 1 [Capsicum chinense]|uniref:Ammonium transporter n=1 Tax=Capsicum annuum TaxID=4072 RepID=A0A1U8G9B8_CAPAN|nr:ammonium transporter 2 member 5 [Capsicum annuum]KAF3680701.1 Ammonium transporter 3 member 1 [Capsicum annuum]PHT86816.1 Ammonium transporter 3 member 1 [Capsicum annuum]PHU22256.1 Ammonium transporter 3 member 1 [Capsicum chinense]